MIPILESIQETDQPRRLGSCQDISFDQDVFHFIHLCQGRLLHLLKRADFARVGFTCEEDGSITSLSDLVDDYGTSGAAKQVSIAPTFHNTPIQRT
jgi:hypothetical protein